MTGRMLFGVIPIYGLLIAAAILAGVLLCGRDEARLGLPRDTAVDMALYAVPFGIVGARLYYVAFQWPAFAQNPVRILYVWEGGLAIYGAVIGGLLGCWLLSRRRGISLLAILDMTAPALLLGQAVGRWGNFFNGEAFGYEVTNPAWQFFPAAVFVDGVWHMATFFYESAWNFAGFAWLYGARKRMERRGQVFFNYLLVYGAGRMVIEGLRTDSLMLGNLRVSQALSVALCAAALAVFARWFLRRRGAVLACLAGGLALVAAHAVTGVFALMPLAAAAFLAGGLAGQKERAAPARKQA